jgi:Xaa-Pro dipeptidase
MQEYLRSQVDWPQAFPPEEYKTRVDNVRQSLSAKGIDAIYVTIPEDITYLTAYDMIWYHLRNLTGVLVTADAEGTVFFDGKGHTTLVSTTPELREIVWLERGGFEDNITSIANALKDRGLANGTIALQGWSYSPHASVIEALGDRLKQGGANVVDGSMIVEDLRFVKSPLEIEVVRKASEIGDTAMEAARDAIRPGVTETELEGVIMHSMMSQGGGYPGIRTMLGSGPRAGTHHSPPSLRQVQQGDLVFVDFCGCYQRYHVNVNRTFSLGEPDPRWVDLMDKSAGCVDAILAAVKPGDPLSKVQKVGNEYIDDAGLRKWVWFVGGYATGIAIPPDWVGSHRFGPGPDGVDRAFEAGMMLNFENQFDVWEDWPGGSGAAYIDTFLMTEDRLEVLSPLPRNLVVV